MGAVKQNISGATQTCPPHLRQVTNIPCVLGFSCLQLAPALPRFTRQPMADNAPGAGPSSDDAATAGATGAKGSSSGVNWHQQGLSVTLEQMAALREHLRGLDPPRMLGEAPGLENECGYRVVRTRAWGGMCCA